MQRYWNMKDKDGQGRAVSCKESLLRKVEPRAISSNTSDGFKVPVKASRPTSIAHSCSSLRSSASMKSGDRPKGDRECRDRHKGGEVSGSSADDERLIVAGDVAKLVRRQRAVVERELAQLSELDSCSETSSVSEKQGRFRESGSQTLSARSLEDLYRSGVVVRPSSPLNIREHPWVVESQIETPDCTVPTKDTFKDLNLSKLAPGNDKHLAANSFDSKGTSGKVSSKQKGTILDSLDLLKPPSSYQRGVPNETAFKDLDKGDIEVLSESHKELTTEELEQLTSDALASPEKQDDDSDDNEGEAPLHILLFNTVI
uniref:Uncharacterized protein n=1 Tax=Timema shepardi TaxID=629360 RepID=A0A7R9AP79_TIMSH|nr:unnamed protein product [Timema shepardi]